MSCGTVGAIVAVVSLSAGFVPFIFIAWFASPRMGSRLLLWLSFVTGVLLAPGIWTVNLVARGATGLDLDLCTDGLKPLCSMGAGLVAEVTVFSLGWLAVMVVTSARRRAV
jgi:hypothetical protein